MEGLERTSVARGFGTSEFEMFRKARLPTLHVGEKSVQCVISCKGQPRGTVKFVKLGFVDRQSPNFLPVYRLEDATENNTDTDQFIHVEVVVVS
jgi:hypothetical protein